MPRREPFPHRWRRPPQRSPNPVERGKPGSKIHVVCDRAGPLLAVTVTAANVHDSQLLLPMLDIVPAIRTPAGRRR
ncbi:transposase [Micromonospora sp. MP36]|nr:transposase [Micromonospora sp. MP36]